MLTLQVHNGQSINVIAIVGYYSKEVCLLQHAPTCLCKQPTPQGAASLPIWAHYAPACVPSATWSVTISHFPPLHAAFCPPGQMRRGYPDDLVERVPSWHEPTPRMAFPPLHRNKAAVALSLHLLWMSCQPHPTPPQHFTFTSISLSSAPLLQIPLKESTWYWNYLQKLICFPCVTGYMSSSWAAEKTEAGSYFIHTGCPHFL